MNSAKTIDRFDLWTFCANSLNSVGVALEEVDAVTDALVEADLRGVYSHGSALLPVYIDRIMAGKISKRANYKVEKRAKSAFIINADNGLGHFAAKLAMNLAVARARKTGVALVSVTKSNHFGMAAHYAMKALPTSIGVVLTVSNINTMAPWGGLDVLLGNNPIAIAIPANKEFPVVYDGAFSIAARRKVHLAAGKPDKCIPAGWALDKDGYPTTDAKEALEGILLPIGGYKGYGMAFAISLLAGALTGSAFGASVQNTNVGHFIMAINVSTFQKPADKFKRSVDAAIHEMRNAKKAPGINRIFIPGERGFLRAREQSTNGIVLAKEIVSSLEQLAHKLNLVPPMWRR